MAKQTRRARAEAKTAVTPAEKMEKKPAARPAEPAPREKMTLKDWLPVALGLCYMLVTCLLESASIKGMAAILLLAAIAVMLLRQTPLAKRMSWPGLILALYVLMDGISTLYALSGKFALYEFLEVISAAAILILMLVIAYSEEKDCSRGIATVLELGMAFASLISIDSVSTGFLIRVFQHFMVMFSKTYNTFQPFSGGRMVSVFTNANVYAGAAALAILLSLSLANSAEKRRERWTDLSCLLINCVGFLLAISRGAMASLGVAFIVYLLLERGQRKSNAFVLMVETLVVSVLAAIPGYRTLSAGVDPLAMAAVIAGAAALCALDHFVGRKLSAKMGQRGKLINWIVAGALVLGAGFAALALTLTGPATLTADEPLFREAKMPAGDYTLVSEADGPVDVSVVYVNKELAMQGKSTSLYSGDLADASFTVPEDATAVFYYFTAQDGTQLREVRYTGASEGQVKLRYTLLPEGIAYRLQGMFTSESYVQRTVYVEDGMKLFKRSPVFGLGMGSFENASISIQTYHYESKYVHNHYLQCMIDTGVIGLALFVLLLLSCAWAVIKMWLRGENAHPLTAALGAALVYMAIHCSNEIIFSTNFFLTFAFGVFALIILCCGETLPLPGGEKVRLWITHGETALMAVFMVLLGMNMYANSLTNTTTFDNLATAARIDPYEKNDHMLSYVYNASKIEDRPQYMQDLMEKFEPKLEAASSNTIPYYLAESYFCQGRLEDAFRMLKQYVNYTISNEDHWAQAFVMALQYYDDDPAFREGVLELRTMMNDWNAANVGKITLPEEVELYLQAYLGI